MTARHCNRKFFNFGNRHVNSFPDPDVIIYGGAFDPPHNGHMHCVKLARQRFPHAAVLVCPTYAPLRDATSVPKQTLLDFKARLHLARAVFKGKGITVSDLEARLPRPTLTANTLQMVRKKFPRHRLALLLGQDQFSTLYDWQRVQEITACCDIIVARRADAATLADSATQLAHYLATSLVWDSQRQRYANANFSVYRLAAELLNISSTAVRAQQQRGAALPDVPTAVADFFRKGEQSFGT